MCSTRNGIRVALVLGIAGIAGCQKDSPRSNLSPLNDTPLVIDDAMQSREDWERSSAFHPSGATVAGGTGYVWESGDSVPEEYRRLTEAPVAVLNFLSLPVGLFTNSPLKSQVARGEVVPPTFHANPPIPGNASGGSASSGDVVDSAQPPQDSAVEPAVEPVMPQP